MYEYNGIRWNDITSFSEYLMKKSFDIECVLGEFGIDKNLKKYFEDKFNNFEFSNACIYYKLTNESFSYSLKDEKIVMQNYLLLAQNVFTDLFIYKHNPSHKNCSKNIIEILYFYIQLRKYIEQENKNFSKCIFTHEYKKQI